MKQFANRQRSKFRKKIIRFPAYRFYPIIDVTSSAVKFVINICLNLFYPPYEETAVKNTAIGKTSNNKQKGVCLPEGFDMLITYTTL